MKKVLFAAALAAFFLSGCISVNQYVETFQGGTSVVMKVTMASEISEQEQGQGAPGNVPSDMDDMTESVPLYADEVVVIDNETKKGIMFAVHGYSNQEPTTTNTDSFEYFMPYITENSITYNFPSKAEDMIDESSPYAEMTALMFASIDFNITIAPDEDEMLEGIAYVYNRNEEEVDSIQGVQVGNATHFAVPGKYWLQGYIIDIPKFKSESGY